MKLLTKPSFTTALAVGRISVALLLALVGCATPERVPEPVVPEPTPVVEISETTWLQVDSDIGAASLAAAGPARHFARVEMERWRQLVASRVEADFIPWFSGYWTQQWLSARIAWYKLSASEEKEAVVNRLATYLQVEFRDRVLAPVAAEVDPEAVRAQATQYYVQSLRSALQPIALLYDLPPEQFDRRLKAIPAIELTPPATHNASLYQLLHAGKLDSLPAYAALLEQGHQAAIEAGAGLSTTRISPVARRVSEKLLERLAISGGASAISALIGGIAGSVITLGAASVGIMLHESARGPTEALLRENLTAGVEDIWHSLMEDPVSRVTAGIDYLSDQIEKCCPRTFGQPIELPGLLEQAPLTDEPDPQPETAEDGAVEENANDDEPPGFKSVD